MTTRSLSITALLALTLAFPIVASSDPPKAKPSSEARTLDDLTESVNVVTRPDGVTVTTRAFKTAIPWDEYVSALAAESADRTVLFASTAEDPLPTPSEPGVCIPPDGDYDGDGFVGAADIDFYGGEFVPATPDIVADWGAQITPSLDWQYTGSTTWNTRTEQFTQDLKQQKLHVIDSIEVHQTLNTKIGLKLILGWKNLEPVFGLDLAGTSWNLIQKSDYTWKEELIRDIQERNTITYTGVESGSLEVNTTSGKITGEVTLTNMGPLDISISSVRIGVRAYSPYVSQPTVIGDYNLQGVPYLIGFGDGNDSVMESVVMENMNTHLILQALAEGWVWDFAIGEIEATVLATGESVVVRNSQINSRNARISIHYGADEPREFGRVSKYLANDECLTGKTMLEQSVGPENVEFDRMDDGTLVVKRIKTKSNNYADRDFDSLTEVEQAYYGRWAVGFHYHDNRSDDFDLETTYLEPEDKIFFYYVKAADFLEVSSSANESHSFQVGGADGYPTEELVMDGVTEWDELELEVQTAFQIPTTYTNSYDKVSVSIPSCFSGYLFGATYHGYNIAVNSAVDSYAVSDPDFYGMEVRFGGDPFDMEWMDIETLMSDERAAADLSMRGYPYYDYKVKFRATPEMLGGDRIRNVQVRNVTRHSIDVGWTGYNILGQHIDCRQPEYLGYINDGVVRQWYAPPHVDKDLDGFYAIEDGGVDFDDDNARRFPEAPEHLDFVNNDGDAETDEEPLICPVGLVAFESGACQLDDRMGWYGDNPDVSMEFRTRYIDGAAGEWESLGSGTTCSFLMPGEADVAGAEIRTTNWGLDGSPSGVNFVAQASNADQSYPVTEDIEAELGIIASPMEVQSDGVSVWVVTPLGTEDASDAAAEYRVRIETAGNYYVWARVRAEDARSDSFYVQVIAPDGDLVRFGQNSDTSALFRFDTAEPPITYGAFSWTLVNHWWNLVDLEYNYVPVVYYLGPGVYTIRFTVRDLGTELDAIRVEPFPFACSGADLDRDGWTTCEGDCWDKNDDVNPGVAESCATSYDDDCDGERNEGCGSWPKEPPAAKPVFD